MKSNEWLSCPMVRNIFPRQKIGKQNGLDFRFMMVTNSLKKKKIGKIEGERERKKEVLWL